MTQGSMVDGHVEGKEPASVAQEVFESGPTEKRVGGSDAYSDASSQAHGCSRDVDHAKEEANDSTHLEPAGHHRHVSQPEDPADRDQGTGSNVQKLQNGDELEKDAKLAELRGVIGMGIDEQALTELLDAAGGEVLLALESFFEEEKCTSNRAQNKDSRRGTTGLRRPYEDMAQLLGKGVEGELLAPMLVAAGGDIELAVEQYFEQKEAHAASAPERERRRRAEAEAYYKRPEGEGQPVYCNIYDLTFVAGGAAGPVTKGKANSGFPGVGLGVYHSGIEVYGREFAFGYAPGGVSGVFEAPPRCAPGVMPNITFREQVHLGPFFRSRFELEHLLQRLAAKYRGDTYDLVRRNCNHFSAELAQCLTGSRLPSYVNRPANVGRGVLNVFAVPALAVGKLLEGVRKVNRIREAKEMLESSSTARPVALGGLSDGSRGCVSAQGAAKGAGAARESSKGGSVGGGGRAEKGDDSELML